MINCKLTLKGFFSSLCFTLCAIVMAFGFLPMFKLYTGLQIPLLKYLGYTVGCFAVGGIMYHEIVTKFESVDRTI